MAEEQAKAEPQGETTEVAANPEPQVEAATVTEKSEPQVEAAAVAEKPEPQAEVTAVVAKPEPQPETVAAVAKPEPQTALAADVPLLRIEAVVKKFGVFRAVDRLSLDIRAGEFFALLGPSGCGKTTLLRMLAGFETPDEGRILLDGQDIAQVLPHQRPVNMMFQNYALFPHLSVRENIAFGLRRANLVPAEIDSRIAELVALLKLEGLEKRKPDQISGGQKQRVALARALAPDPRVLLMDEPFSSLDALTRDQLYRDFQEIWESRKLTVVLVTHNVREAVCLADRVVLMSTNPGRIRDEFAIPLPRPRDINAPELAIHAQKIAAALKSYSQEAAA
jgi:putrescine transport system ATP-binding protein